MARKREYFGTLTLNDQIWKDVGDAELAAAMLDGVLLIGLTRTPSAARLLTHVQLAPDAFSGFDEGTLLRELNDWLLPYLTESQHRKLGVLISQPR